MKNKLYTPPTWDNVMMMVDEIESIEDQRHQGFEVIIKKDSCYIQSKNRTKEDSYSVTYVSPKNKLTAVYESCLRFINWYDNKNK